MKAKKDILFLCQFFYPEYISSAMLPFDTAAYLASQGKSVGAMCGYPYEYNIAGEVPKKEVKDGIEIRRVRYSRFDKKKKLGRIINFFSLTAAFFAHLGAIKQYRDIVVYTNPPLLPMVALAANRLWGTGITFVCYDIYPELGYATGAFQRGGMIARFMDRLNRKVYLHAKNIVALSGEMKRFIVENRNVDPEKVHVIHNWHSASYGNVSAGGNRGRAEVIERLKKDTEGKFVVSYFGNMGLCQDMDIVVDAAKRLAGNKDIVFLMAGHGCKFGDVKAAAQNGCGNIAIYDYLFDSEFDLALKLSDCCIVTLIDEIHALSAPSKIYSYLYAGKPVLAAMRPECDIVRELEHYGAGCGVTDADMLACAISDLQSDPERLQSAKAACARMHEEKHLKRYSMEKYAALFK